MVLVVPGEPGRLWAWAGAVAGHIVVLAACIGAAGTVVGADVCCMVERIVFAVERWERAYCTAAVWVQAAVVLGLERQG